MSALQVTARITDEKSKRWNRRFAAMIFRASHFAICVFVLAAAAEGGEISGYVSVEGRLFFHDPLFPDQEHNNGSLAAQPEYYHQWDDGSSFTFVPFGRLDSADDERTHVDIRELNYLYPGDSWFFRVGVGKVFWGASEFVHSP